MKPRTKTLLEWSAFLMICAATGILLAQGIPLWKTLIAGWQQLLLELHLALADPYAFM